MKTTTVLGAVLGMFGLATAHMEMKVPAPFRSKFNPNTNDIDYSMTNPLRADGSDFPCKGYHSLLGTSAGAPTATWTPGQSYSMTISGSTPHNGGSCQASLSFDRGATWKVVHSYIGNCPVMGDSSYQFALPSDTPSGQALFAWTWFNQIGNREMYMNCAAVTIAGRKRSAKDRRQSDYSTRPAMFVGNVRGDKCKTIEGKDLEFPNPGPKVTRFGSNTAPPTAGC